MRNQVKTNTPISLENEKEVIIMLKNWTPAEIPSKEEIKSRLDKSRSRLYELQMKIKEHKLPVLVLFEGWGSSGKGSTIGKVIKNIEKNAKFTA